MTQRYYRHAYIGALLALTVVATTTRIDAGDPEPSVWPTPRPLGWDIPTLGAKGTAKGTDTSPAKPRQEPQGALTLPSALELAALHSPALAASACGVRAAEAISRQADALPNPEIEIEAEDIGGSGESTGYDAAQTTVRLSQTVELAGKRGKRQSIALSEARLAGWDYEAARLDALTQTKKAFVDVLLAQGRLALAESALVLAEDVRRAAGERVKAGKVAPLEETRAGVEVSLARLSRDKAKRNLVTARQLLAASWGGTTPLFTEGVGDWAGVKETPALATLMTALDQAPELASWGDRIRSSQAAVAQAKAERVPDITLSAGISRLEDDGTQAGLVGLSLPLPLFNRNAGNILAATHLARRMEYDRQAARLRAVTALTDAYSRLETAGAEAATIKAELLPSSQQAFDAAQRGYREGKFGYLDVLDAQRTLNETLSRQLEALADYHKAAADVERLTGIPLNTLQ